MSSVNSLQFKKKYSETTVDRTINSLRTVAQTWAAYDSGVLRVPCVQLVCVGFNRELYMDLVKANGVSVSASSPCSLNSSKGKRRIDDDDGDDDCISPPRKSHKMGGTQVATFL